MKAELIYNSPQWLIVEAARASFGKSHTQYTEEQNNKLIRFLAREGHYLPFRHPQITLRCKAPLFVARQLGKYQVGGSWSEESRRYIDSEPEFYHPTSWRERVVDKKQGSGEHIHANLALAFDIDYSDFLARCLKEYKEMLRFGICPEQARFVLPQATYTTWIWTGSLLFYWNMYRQRMKEATQQETLDMVKLIGEEVSSLYPVAWEALNNE